MLQAAKFLALLVMVTIGVKPGTSEDEFDFLILSQTWTVTTCDSWESKSEDNTCSWSTESKCLPNAAYLARQFLRQCRGLNFEVIKPKFGTYLPGCMVNKYLNFWLRIFIRKIIMNFLVNALKKSRAQQYYEKLTFFFT